MWYNFIFFKMQTRLQKWGHASDFSIILYKFSKNYISVFLNYPSLLHTSMTILDQFSASCFPPVTQNTIWYMFTRTVPVFVARNLIMQKGSSVKSLKFNEDERGARRWLAKRYRIRKLKRRCCGRLNYLKQFFPTDIESKM